MSNRLQILVTLFLRLHVFPHELGHFILRRHYGVWNEALVLGNPNGHTLLQIGWLRINTYSRVFGGGVIPLNQDRSWLRPYQKTLISIAGVFMDLCGVLFLLFIREHIPSTVSWILLFPILLMQSSAFANMVPKTIDGFDSDGMKIWKIGKRHWILSVVFVLCFSFWNFYYFLTQFE